jgi:hypothetical protein
MVYYQRLVIHAAFGFHSSVTNVTDSHIAVTELIKHLAVKRIADDSRSLMHREHTVIVNGDTGTFLTPVLKGVQTVIDASCNVTFFLTDYSK